MNSKGVPNGGDDPVAPELVNERAWRMVAEQYEVPEPTNDTPPGLAASYLHAVESESGERLEDDAVVLWCQDRTLNPLRVLIALRRERSAEKAVWMRTSFEKLDEQAKRRIVISEAARVVAGFRLYLENAFIRNDAITDWAHVVVGGLQFDDQEQNAVMALAGHVAESILDQPVGSDRDTELFSSGSGGVRAWLFERRKSGFDLDLDLAIEDLSLLCNFDRGVLSNEPEAFAALEWLALHTHRLLTESWEEVELLAAEFLTAGTVSAERMWELLTPGLSIPQDC